MISFKCNGKLYKDQWLIIAVMSIVMVLGISWGLPNKQRIELLSGGSTPEKDEIFLMNSLSGRYSYGSEVTEGWNGWESEAGARTGSYIYYLISSSAQDEFNLYKSFSNINPAKLDFDPKFYHYGGAYLYPVAAILYLFKSINIFYPTLDFTYYYHNPSHIRNMFISGRMLTLSAFVGTLILLGLFGNIFDGRVAGTLSMLTYSFSTLVLNQSLVSKPHIYAAFWAFLAVYQAVLYIKHQKTKFIIISAIASGLAIGSSQLSIPIAIIYPIMLFDRFRIKQTIKYILLTWIVVVTVFFLTNPFILLNFNTYKSSMGQNTSIFSLSAYNSVLYLKNIFIKAHVFPATIIGFFLLFSSFSKNDNLLKKLTCITSILLFIVALGFSGTYLRWSLFLSPLICLLSGIGINRLIFQSSGLNKFVKGCLVVLIFSPGVFFTMLFARDVIFDAKWYEPTVEWIKSGPIDSKTTIGIFGTRVYPVSFPPFPFIKGKLVDIQENLDEQDLPDYVLISLFKKEKFLGQWNQHRFRSNYHLAYNLGDRPSYWWFSNIRTKSLSRISAFVYQLNDF
jgi:hypothetical protein|tara:strand:- start:202 stop:1893 length:1692 start_codon:yes stop_codon:yes gene_type:complete